MEARYVDNSLLGPSPALGGAFTLKASPYHQATKDLLASVVDRAVSMVSSNVEWQLDN